MADQAQLEVVIEAQADRVLQGLASFESSLGRLENAHSKAEHAAKQHGNEVKNLEHQLESFKNSVERVAEKTEFMAMGFEHFRAIFGAGAGIFGFVELIKGAMDFDVAVQKMAAALNGDAVAGSEWLAVAEKMGLNQEVLLRSLTHFSAEINNGGGLLREMGIAAEDANGHLRSMNDVLLDAVDWFHAHAGASNEAAMAQKLFGKSGAEMLPVLEQGRGAINAITEEARKYGLILDGEALKRQLAFTYEIKAGQDAVHGLAINLGNALLPALAGAAQGLSNFVANHLKQFIAAVEGAVSYIIGLGEAFGLWDSAASAAATTQAEATASVGDFGDAVNTGASGAKAMAAAQRELREATKAQTDALNEQIRQLDEQQKAFDRTIGDQIKTLEDAQKNRNFDDKQTKVKQEEATKQAEIERLKQEAILQFYLGNFTQAQSIQQQITRLTQEKANLEKDYEKNSQDEQTRIKIEGLQKTQQIHRDETDHRKQALQDQVRAVQEASNLQLQAMQDAASGGTEALRSAAGQYGGIGGKGGKDFAEKFAINADMEARGRKMADEIRNADWAKVGVDVGSALGGALATEVGRRIRKELVLGLGGELSHMFDLPKVDGGLFGGFMNWIGSVGDDGIPRRAAGGPVSAGGMYMVGERGPEIIQMGSGGSGHVTSNGDLSGLLEGIHMALGRVETAIYATAPSGASLSDFGAASSAAQSQRMRGVLAASF